MRLRTVSALDVKEGDVIYVGAGFRVRVSNVRIRDGAAQFTLHSEPSKRNPNPLPVGYEGMQSGGNRSRRVPVEMTPAEIAADDAIADSLIDSHESDYATISNQR